jgi:hypothetical protein
LPTPPSSPLASGSDKPASSGTLAPPQPLSKGPSVTVYDEQEYSCQRGDTWEELSQRYYRGTDRYAKALQRHNQNHFRASEQMAKTGQLAPGERIFIPQAYILEERYADAIVKPSPGAASTTVPAKFDPNNSLPAPVPLPTNGTAPPPRNP